VTRSLGRLAYRPRISTPEAQLVGPLATVPKRPDDISWWRHGRVDPLLAAAKIDL